MKTAKTMKDKIIELLLSFDERVYNNLYRFLQFDNRVEQFRGASGFVDTAITLQQKKYPESIYQKLCNHEIKVWRISEELLFEVLSDRINPQYWVVCINDYEIDGRKFVKGQTNKHTSSRKIVSDDWRIATIEEVARMSFVRGIFFIDL